jgi:hypothetical protein
MRIDHTFLCATLRALYAQNGTDYVQTAADEIERLDAEIERLRADAERYRWLRENAVHEKPLGDKYIKFHCDFETWNDVDAAIDAAMQESGYD